MDFPEKRRYVNADKYRGSWFSPFAWIALIIFVLSKLPELGRAVGSTLKEFKKLTRDLGSDEEPSKEESNK